MTVTTPIGMHAAIHGINLVQDLSLPATTALRSLWLRLAACLLANRPWTRSTVAAPTTATAVRIIGATGGELGNARQSAVQRSDEVCALLAESEAARLQRVARQEIARERKPIGQIVADEHNIRFAQKCRQP